MEEFAGAQLGDGRLNERLIKLAARFADKPTASIPGACPDWAETQAVYRFFDQASDDKPLLSWQDILDPHFAQTEARMRQHPVVLCLQDSTDSTAPFCTWLQVVGNVFLNAMCNVFSGKHGLIPIAIDRIRLFHSFRGLCA